MTGQVPGSVEAPDDKAELLLGINLGPQAAQAETIADGVVITVPSSPWNRTRCTTCGHTFRRGDRVLVSAVTRVVQHLVPGLDCGVDPEPGLHSSVADRDELAAGLLTTWPPGVPVSRLAPGDWRIPRPGRPPHQQPPVCLYCGHSFRAGEYVIICPCTPWQPGCGAAVHRDPAAGLACWDTWRPEGKLTVCPITMARL